MYDVRPSNWCVIASGKKVWGPLIKHYEIWCREDAGWFVRTFCWPVMEIQFVRISPKIAFLNFHHEGCGLSRLSVLRMQGTVGFVSKPCFLCLNIIFHLLVPQGGYVFAMIRQTESFRSAYPSSRCWNNVKCSIHKYVIVQFYQHIFSLVYKVVTLCVLGATAYRT